MTAAFLHRSAASPDNSGAFPVSTPFKIAFVGAGFIARLQMKHLKQLNDIELCGVADPSDLSLKKMTEEFPDVRQFTDYKVLLKEVTCDAVSVCTPNGLHAENTIAALEAGKHVIVEKPMAMNAKEAQKMLDAAKRAGKQLVIGFQHRFDAKTKLIRDQIAANSFGKVLYVRAQALRRAASRTGASSAARSSRAAGR
jgi:predicted dehydrogenase